MSHWKVTAGSSRWSYRKAMRTQHQVLQQLQVTQSDFWDNLPSLAKFGKLLPASEHFCKHSSVCSKVAEVQCSHNRNLSAFAATIVNANTGPVSHLMMSFKIIIANICHLPTLESKRKKKLKKKKFIGPLKTYQERPQQQNCIRLL